MVRSRLMLAGEPVIENPARCGRLSWICFSPRLTRLGQFHVLEKQIEEFVARQNEQEFVVAVTVVAAGLAATATSAGRWLSNAIASAEGLVAGGHVIAPAGLVGVPEGRLGDRIRRNRNVLAPIGVRDTALAHSPRRPIS